MQRLYTSIVEMHLKKYRQMVFLAGPRQVGKATCSKSFKNTRSPFYYINWENSAHKKLIIQGPEAVARYLSFETIAAEKPLVVFDEVHKYKKWKLFLKGFFDLYENDCQIIVTGSAKLNVYRKGG